MTLVAPKIYILFIEYKKIQGKYFSCIQIEFFVPDDDPESFQRIAFHIHNVDTIKSFN